jgi:hypothetical protein
LLTSANALFSGWVLPPISIVIPLIFATFSPPVEVGLCGLSYFNPFIIAGVYLHEFK